MPEAKKLTKGVAASTPAPEPETPAVSENLVKDPAIAPLLQPPQTQSQLLKDAQAQMEAELTALQGALDCLSDDYANRAETMVKNWLVDCRNKAKHRINAIELADFFGNGEPALPPTTQPESLPEATLEAEAIEC